MIAAILALALVPSAPAQTARPPAVATQSLPGLPIDILPPQDLPATGCAAYLWSVDAEGKRELVAMAGADPASLRIALDGAVANYPRVTQGGTGGFGFSTTATYGTGDLTATLNMTITTRADLTNGAAVPEATLRIDRPGKDGVVLPLVGLIGCAPPS